MDMSFMKIFDVIIGALGIYLLVMGIKSFKEGIVNTTIITVEEQQKCKNLEALSQYLMPKTAIFGAFCVIFGVQGFVSDMNYIKFPYLVDVGFLVAFLIVWFVFSFAIRKAKKLYII